MTDEEWAKAPESTRMWLIEMALRYGSQSESLANEARRIADVLAANNPPAEEETLDAPVKNWRTERGLDV